MATEFPGDRPATYDEDLAWDENAQAWVDTESVVKQGGGRYRTQLVTVCNYQVFFEETV